MISIQYFATAQDIIDAYGSNIPSNVVCIAGNNDSILLNSGNNNPHTDKEEQDKTTVVDKIKNQNITVDPTEETIILRHDDEYTGLGTVTITGIQASRLMKYITENGEYHYTPEDGHYYTGIDIEINVQPELQDKEVEPSRQEQVIGCDEGKYGLRSVTVKAVTAEIDPDIKAENIRKGVEILGVYGTFAPIVDNITITPTTSRQSFVAPEGVDGYDKVFVEAVTSSIDGNILPENIKEGVNILGVAGSHKGEKPEESFNVQPTTAEQTITPTEGSVFSGGTVKAVTSAIDSNIQPENIKEGVTILGVAGTLSEGAGDTQDYRYMNGTVDRSGLKAIGWTDEDILTYEQNSPSHYAWQNDQYKVSDENKALYNLDDPDPSSYKDNPNITFVPNKNMESHFAHDQGFYDMKYIKGIPFYDTSNVTYMFGLFSGCRSLITIPQLDTSKVTNMMGLFQNCSRLTSVPPLDTSNVTDMRSMFADSDSNTGLTTIPQFNTSKVTNMESMFQNCSSLTTIPPLDTSKVTNMDDMFWQCYNLKTVEGIDFSGLTSNPNNFFAYYSEMPNLTRFIVNGKINTSISDEYSIKALTKIDYDSVKSILAAADRTDNTNAKELAFNRTMTDQNGELAALVASCASKGWTITGLTLN